MKGSLGDRQRKNDQVVQAASAASLVRHAKHRLAACTYGKAVAFELRRHCQPDVVVRGRGEESG